MIFRNATALLNAFDEDRLQEMGIFLLQDGTIEGLPDFPFEVEDQPQESDGEYRSPVVPKGRTIGSGFVKNHSEPLNPIPFLMENITRSRTR